MPSSYYQVFLPLKPPSPTFPSYLKTHPRPNPHLAVHLVDLPIAQFPNGNENRVTPRHKPSGHLTVFSWAMRSSGSLPRWGLGALGRITRADTSLGLK